MRDVEPVYYMLDCLAGAWRRFKKDKIAIVFQCREYGTGYVGMQNLAGFERCEPSWPTMNGRSYTPQTASCDTLGDRNDMVLYVGGKGLPPLRYFKKGPHVDIAQLVRQSYHQRGDTLVCAAHDLELPCLLHEYLACLPG